MHTERIMGGTRDGYCFGLPLSRQRPDKTRSDEYLSAGDDVNDTVDAAEHGKDDAGGDECVWVDVVSEHGLHAQSRERQCAERVRDWVGKHGFCDAPDLR